MTWHHTEETKRKMRKNHANIQGKRNPFYGKHHTRKTKEKLSKMSKGKHYSPQSEFKKGYIPWNKDLKQKPPISENELYELYSNQKLSQSTVASVYRVHENTIRKWMRYYNIKTRLAGKGTKLSEETKKRISETHWTKDPKWKDKFDVFKEKYAFKKGMISWSKGLTKEDHPGLKSLSEYQREQWANPDIREARIKKWIETNQIRPTKPELKFLNFCKKHRLPYDYVGDGKIVIGGFIPDFVNSNGKKEVILIHGIYWHLWKPQKDNPDLTKEMIEQMEIEHYQKFGNFKCKVIWEDELEVDNWEQIILDKLDIMR